MVILGVIFIIAVLIYPTIKFILYLISLGVGGIAYESATSSVQRGRRNRKDAPVSNDNDWTEDEFTELLVKFRSGKELRNAGQNWIDFTINYEGYEHFYDYIKLRMCDKRFERAVAEEFGASLWWMNKNKKSEQPLSYLSQTFLRYGVYEDIATIKKLYGENSVPEDFRVISEGYRNPTAIRKLDMVDFWKEIECSKEDSKIFDKSAGDTVIWIINALILAVAVIGCIFYYQRHPDTFHIILWVIPGCVPIGLLMEAKVRDNGNGGQ